MQRLGNRQADWITRSVISLPIPEYGHLIGAAEEGGGGKVILLNDDYTPREFVVTVLKAEFRMTEDQAYKVMITAHRRGVCVVAVFTKDVAETKATRATDAGRAKGYPLLFTTEPEE